MIINSGGNNMSYDSRVDLLWENTNTNVAFPAQTISFDTTPYELLYIVIRENTSSDYVKTNAVLVDYDITQTVSYFLTNYSYGRDVTISVEGVTFSIGGYKYYTGNGSTVQASSSAAIPYRIYGVKRWPTT